MLRTMIGGMTAPDVATWDDDQLLHTVRTDLKATMGIPLDEPAMITRIYRHARAIPQYHVGHADLVQIVREAEARHPGFFATGNALDGIGIADCIRESYRMATQIEEYLKKHP